MQKLLLSLHSRFVSARLRPSSVPLARTAPQFHLVRATRFVAFRPDCLIASLAAVVSCILLSGCGGMVVNSASTSSSSSAGFSASPGTVEFGSVNLGNSGNSVVSLINSTIQPVVVSQLTLSSDAFSVEGNLKLPLTVDAASTTAVKVHFHPKATGDATGLLTITSNYQTSSRTSVKLHGKGAKNGSITTTALSAFTCSTSSFTGSGTESCTTTLNTAAPSGGFVVSLSSSNSAVSVPTSVTVPAGATSAGLTATVSAVSTSQTAIITASASGVTQTFSMQLNAAVPTLTLNTASLSFGSVALNTSATPQPVTLTSTGTAPVTVSAAAVTGAGFAISGGTFPVTLNPGQQKTLSVEFDPTATGVAAGQVIISSNSPTNGTAVISLSGTGTAAPAALSALYCSSGAMTGSGSDACTVTLTAAAPSGGLNVSLSSSSSAVTVPSTVTVPANATSAGFTATVASVATAQAVTMTASAGGVFKNFTLQLNAAILALSINATNVAFGEVVVNTSATQSVTLTSTGTSPVTISAATLTGKGFTMPGASFPVALNPGQAVTLNVQFDPTTAGAVTGQLTITSNSSTNGTAVIGLSGTGTAPPQVVAVTVTPTTVSTTAGTNQQFAASVTGTSDTAVTWTASGTGCTGVTCGTISSSGLYTAPATVPSPATVTITATSVSDPTKSASATVTIVPSSGKTYYLAPAAAGGNDSNNGLSTGAPWLTPNHSVNCGDVIQAAPGTYSAANFSLTFGTVTCPAGNNVAWLNCATFDGCKISSATALSINKSNWGVQGWEVHTDVSAGNGPCFMATPYPGSTTVHHIIFANNIANGCSGSGFYGGSYGSVGVDYFVLIGNIAYNATQGSTSCTSGLNIFEPSQLDSLPGTHIYVAGNFSYNNIEPNPCAGTQPTDGEGIIFDTFNAFGYGQQTVADNNMLLANGGRGIGFGGNSPSTVYLRHNTSWGNEGNPSGLSTNECAEIALLNATGTQATLNLAVTNAVNGCGGTNPIYAFFVSRTTTGDVVDQNWGYSASGTNAGLYLTSGFSYGPNNVFDTNPVFANPVAPGAPSCSGKTNVPACMATAIANFTPTNVAAKSYGYQTPGGTSVYDPLFPQWLCNVNLPAGLVTMGCQAGP